MNNKTNAVWRLASLFIVEEAFSANTLFCISLLGPKYLGTFKTDLQTHQIPSSVSYKTFLASKLSGKIANYVEVSQDKISLFLTPTAPCLKNPTSFGRVVANGVPSSSVTYVVGSRSTFVPQTISTTLHFSPLALLLPLKATTTTRHAAICLGSILNTLYDDATNANLFKDKKGYEFIAEILRENHFLGDTPEIALCLFSFVVMKPLPSSFIRALQNNSHSVSCFADFYSILSSTECPATLSEKYAFATLITDWSLWRNNGNKNANDSSTSVSSHDSFDFLLYGFSVLLHPTNPMSSFNAIQMRECGVVRRILVLISLEETEKERLLNLFRILRRICHLSPPSEELVTLFYTFSLSYCSKAATFTSKNEPIPSLLLVKVFQLLSFLEDVLLYEYKWKGSRMPFINVDCGDDGEGNEHTLIAEITTPIKRSEHKDQSKQSHSNKNRKLRIGKQEQLSLTSNIYEKELDFSSLRLFKRFTDYHAPTIAETTKMVPFFFDFLLLPNLPWRIICRVVRLLCVALGKCGRNTQERFANDCKGYTIVGKVLAAAYQAPKDELQNLLLVHAFYPLLSLLCGKSPEVVAPEDNCEALDINKEDPFDFYFTSRY